MLILLLLSKNKLKKKNYMYNNKFIKNNNNELDNNIKLNNELDNKLDNELDNNNKLDNELDNNNKLNNELDNNTDNNNEPNNEFNNELNNEPNNNELNNNEHNSEIEHYNKINDEYKLENNIDNRINYFIIHMFNSDNLRFNNIKLMRDKLGKCIKIFDGVNGSSIHIDSEKKIILKNKRLQIDNIYEPTIFYLYPGEIGCYLSHVLILETIKEDNGYTCIFEDDFTIEDNLNIKIKNIIDKIDYNFDILYLGNLNYNYGLNYKDNIYYVNNTQSLWGTHGYIIKNNNAKKILQNLLIIDNAIDQKFKSLIDKKILNALVIYPPMVNQNSTYKSTIDRGFKNSGPKRKHPKYILFLLNRKQFY
jgi:GR25 family glycosyltransferase involved in LPS biosynthesis